MLAPAVETDTRPVNSINGTYTDIQGNAVSDGVGWSNHRRDPSFAPRGIEQGMFFPLPEKPVWSPGLRSMAH